MTISFDELRYLEALERLGSASAAARELAVATSTVYRKIAALEKASGVVCLSRGGGVTPAGRELADAARSAQRSITDTARRWREAGSEIEGTVSLTTVSGFIPIITPTLERLATSHPGLRIELFVADHGPSVRRREVDIAISVLEEPPPQLVGRRVLTIRYAVMAVQALASDPDPRWVVLAPPMHVTAQAAWEAENVPRRNVAAATGSRFAFVELVRAGVGIGVLPLPLADRYPDLQRVSSYDTSSLDRPAWILTHPELRNHVRVSVVIEALFDALRER
jgi:DNA-binding transcriptional LysR family regulator